MSAPSSSQRTSTEQYAEGGKMNSRQGIGMKWRRRAAQAALALTALAAGLGISASGASAIELLKAEMSYTQTESTSPLRQAGAHPDITTTFALKPSATNRP